MSNDELAVMAIEILALQKMLECDDWSLSQLRQIHTIRQIIHNKVGEGKCNFVQTLGYLKSKYGVE